MTVSESIRIELYCIGMRGGIAEFMGLMGIIGPGPIGVIEGPPIGAICRIPVKMYKCF